MTPFAVYDTRTGAIVYLGLHECAADCWATFFGWPDAQ